MFWVSKRVLGLAVAIVGGRNRIAGKRHWYSPGNRITSKPHLPWEAGLFEKNLAAAFQLSESSLSALPPAVGPGADLSC
jgi:hypothetical protein